MGQESILQHPETSHGRENSGLISAAFLESYFTENSKCIGCANWNVTEGHRSKCGWLTGLRVRGAAGGGPESPVEQLMCVRRVLVDPQEVAGRTHSTATTLETPTCRRLDTCRVPTTVSLLEGITQNCSFCLYIAHPPRTGPSTLNGNPGRPAKPAAAFGSPAANIQPGLLLPSCAGPASAVSREGHPEATCSAKSLARLRLNPPRLLY